MANWRSTCQLWIYPLCDRWLNELLTSHIRMSLKLIGFLIPFLHQRILTKLYKERLQLMDKEMLKTIECKSLLNSDTFQIEMITFRTYIRRLCTITKNVLRYLKIILLTNTSKCILIRRVIYNDACNFHHALKTYCYHLVERKHLLDKIDYILFEDISKHLLCLDSNFDLILKQILCYVRRQKLEILYILIPIFIDILKHIQQINSIIEILLSKIGHQVRKDLSLRKRSNQIKKEINMCNKQFNCLTKQKQLSIKKIFNRHYFHPIKFFVTQPCTNRMNFYSQIIREHHGIPIQDINEQMIFNHYNHNPKLKDVLCMNMNYLYNSYPQPSPRSIKVLSPKVTPSKRSTTSPKPLLKNLDDFSNDTLPTWKTCFQNHPLLTNITPTTETSDTSIDSTVTQINTEPQLKIRKSIDTITNKDKCLAKEMMQDQPLLTTDKPKSRKVFIKPKHLSKNVQSSTQAPLMLKSSHISMPKKIKNQRDFFSKKAIDSYIKFKNAKSEVDIQNRFSSKTKKSGLRKINKVKKIVSNSTVKIIEKRQMTRNKNQSSHLLLNQSQNYLDVMINDVNNNSHSIDTNNKSKQPVSAINLTKSKSLTIINAQENMSDIFGAISNNSDHTFRNASLKLNRNTDMLRQQSDQSMFDINVSTIVRHC
ncbi:unnamed protein product [Didymodactylos carnosus]|uniref:Uncharacterized protein n=1 Tax=Didymodactylos carnosus TaxID=1234261 RepID=A0A813RUX5_9BILA|nr:unnamed protein product [Didymodactylos carnosus]CAF1415329.1 unnamed protein product [Didymodactylos carnosus]CAF3574606.1 unnamed protein product [Didymodactylos carnosus]CAF4217840.1 unnamed protein product [Didymodactylos carnosus]